MNDDVRAAGGGAGGVRAAHDRLQPALLDRLTDAERERRTEPPDAQA